MPWRPGNGIIIIRFGTDHTNEGRKLMREEETDVHVDTLHDQRIRQRVFSI
jgi:hypothetical protein